MPVNDTKSHTAPGRILLPVLAVVSVAALSCGAPLTGDSGKVRVVASFYPVAFFSQQVGGDLAEVTNLMPPGIEAHEWEPAPRDMGRIERADLLVYNGAGFEPWVPRVLGTLKGQRPLPLNTTEGLQLLQASQDHDEPAQPADSPDPHVWLDPVLAQRQVERIRESLARVDARNQSVYEENARRLTQKLEALHSRYLSGLRECRHRTILTAHAAFGYMAARYSIDVVAIAGLSPEAAPTPSRLAELSRLARDKGVRYVFFETLSSPALADVLAREVGARTLVFNPIEGLTQEQARAGKDYFSLMEENLASLRTAMECR
ncbi:MAG: zinc ABC transporter substrate-binding protein [Chloroflexi bacterium]|nr:zinc ABC transporter substrate-binding protein [Chloroflexota bacterium]